MAGIFVLSALDENNESNWPERWPTETLLERQRLDPIAFASQYLMQPVSMSDNPLKFEWLSFVTMIPDNLVYFIGVDPSPTGKTGTDYFAMAIIGLDPVSERRYLVEAFREQIDPLDQANLIKAKAARYHARLIVIEAYSAQKLFTRYFFGDAGLNIREAKGTNVPKGVRYASMVHYFTSNRVVLRGIQGDGGSLSPHPSVQTFVNEWTEWNDLSNRDDTLDAVGKALEATGLSASVVQGISASSSPPQDPVGRTVGAISVAKSRSSGLRHRPSFFGSLRRAHRRW